MGVQSPVTTSLVPRPCIGAEARMSFSSTGSGSVPPIVGGTGAVNQDVIMFGSNLITKVVTSLAYTASQGRPSDEKMRPLVK